MVSAVDFGSHVIAELSLMVMENIEIITCVIVCLQYYCHVYDKDSVIGRCLIRV